MLNLLTFGMSFLGKDKNLTKTATGIQEEILNIDKTIMGLNDSMGKNSIGMFIGGLAKLPDVKGFASNMLDYAADFKITTTQLEQHWVQTDKAFMRASAGMNLNRQDAKKWKKEIGATAYSLAIDVGHVAETFKAVEQSGIDLAKIGFKDFKEFQKFIEVTGIDAKQFTASLAYLKNTVGFTDDQLKDYLATTATIGKKFNMGTEAMQSMASMTQHLQQENAAMFSMWGPQKTKKFLEGTSLVAGAFLKSGKTAEEAQGAAQHLMGTMAKSQSEFGRMFGGLANNMGEFGTMMAENFGGAEGAFRLLQDSPDQFISKMYETIATIRKLKMGNILAKSFGGKKLEELTKDQRANFDAMLGADMQESIGRFSAQMSDILGPAATDLMRSMGPLGDEFIGLSKELGSPTGLAGKDGALAKMASHYRDGLTAQEQLARSQDRFQTSLKKLAGLNDWNFLKETNKSFALMKDRLKDLDGPAKTVFETMVNLKNYGFGGVLSQIHPLGPAFAELAKSFGPVLQMAPGLVATFGLLASPITVIAGAIALLYFGFKEFNKEGHGLIGTLGQTMKKWIPVIMGYVESGLNWMSTELPKILLTIFDGLVNLVKTINWGAIFSKALEIGKQTIKVMIGFTAKMLDVMVGLLESIDWASVTAALVSGISNIYDSIESFIFNLDWKQIGSTVMNYLVRALYAASKALGAVLTGLGMLAAKLLWKGIKYLAILIWNLPEIITAALKGVVIAVGAVAKGILDGVVGVFSKFKDAIMGPINNAIGSVKKAWDSTKGMASSAWGWLTGGTKKASASIKMSAQEIEAATAKTKARLEAMLKAFAQYANVAVAKTTDVMDKYFSIYTKKTQDGFQITSASINTLADNYSKTSAKMFANLQGDASEATNNVLQSLDTSLAAELTNISKMTFASKAELTAARDLAIKNHEELRKNLDGYVKMNAGSLNNSNKAIRDNAIANLKIFTQESLKLTEKSAGATSDAIASAAAEQGLTVDTATNIMQSLAGTDPKQFRKDIGIVKAVYLDFLNDSVKKTKAITNDAQKAFGEFQKFSHKHWTDEKAAMDKFTSSSLASLENFWTIALKRFEINMFTMTAKMAGVFEKLRVNFGQFNLLEAIAGKDKVYEWAQMIAIALYEALSVKDPFTAALGNYSNNSKKFIENLMNETASAEAGIVSKPAGMKGPEGRAAENLKNELLRATHDPLWAKQAMVYWKQTADSLASLADAMAVQNGKKPVKKSTRPSIPAPDPNLEPKGT